MNKLIIDTANDLLMVVLVKDDQVFSYIGEAKSRHNEAMLPMVDSLLSAHDMEIKDIDEFGVVIGPGSFTGIRVGIATIKAFRDVLGVSAKGINNLDYLFRIAHTKNADINVVAIKGSRNSYFVARLINDIVYKYERNLTLDELREVAGDGMIGMFSEDDDVNCYRVDADANILNECLIDSSDDKLVPVYYQLSQAENEKLKRGNIDILDADIHDKEEIVRIEQDSILNNPLTNQDVELALTNENYKTIKATFNGKIVGFIILQITDEVNITSIAVDKDYRNLGIATRLIDEAKKIASSNGMILSLEVSDKNITAYLLYQKLGFITRRIRKNYYKDGSNAIEMSFSL